MVLLGNILVLNLNANLFTIEQIYEFEINLKGFWTDHISQ